MAELWSTYRATQNVQLRRQLIEQYAPLAKYVVDRLNIQTSAGVSYDDLLGQAILGLIEAIDRYDPARGVKFNTFAYYRIRGAVMDMLRDLDWVPRSLRAKSNEVVQTIATLEAELGRTPTDEEVAKALGLSLQQFDGIAQDISAQSLLSLDDVIVPAGRGTAMAVADAITDEHAISPELYTIETDMRRVLAEAIDALPKNERHVVSLYYHDGLTLKEIGKVLGVTESRVCQIHSKSIMRLRAAMQQAFPDMAII